MWILRYVMSLVIGEKSNTINCQNSTEQVQRTNKRRYVTNYSSNKNGNDARSRILCKFKVRTEFVIPIKDFHNVT